MSFLSALQGEELAILEQYLSPVHFPRNSCIMREGDPGDGAILLMREQSVLNSRTWKRTQIASWAIWSQDHF